MSRDNFLKRVYLFWKFSILDKLNQKQVSEILIIVNLE